MSKTLGSFANLARSTNAPAAPTPDRPEERPIVSRARAGAPTTRRRGTKDRVALSLYLTQGEWQRVHELAMAEGISLNGLMVRGLNKVFQEKGLPALRDL